MPRPRWNAPMPDAQTARFLRRQFNHINRVGYGGRLPRPEILIEPMAIGVGECDRTEPALIFIPGQLRINLLSTLIHEVVHLANPRLAHHGPKFQAEMMRLKKKCYPEWESLW